MKKEAKEKLANVRMYGRRVSEFLLPDQMEFIETAMIEFAAEQANGLSTSHETALHKHFVNARFDDSDEEEEDFEEEEPAYKECMCCGNVQQYGMSCNKCAGPTKDGFL